MKASEKYIQFLPFFMFIGGFPWLTNSMSDSAEKFNVANARLN